MPDGRRLDVRVSGPDGGLPLVFHHGAPGSSSPLRAWERAAQARGLGLVTASRPGYGDSSRQPGRSVAGAAAGIAAVVAAVGAGRCLVVGGAGSGGQPRPVACLLAEPG